MAALCNVARLAAASTSPCSQSERLVGASPSRFACFTGLRQQSSKCEQAAVPAQIRAVKQRQARSVNATAVVETAKETDTTLIDQSVNSIRFLAVDAVEKANSGHPGLPMGCAPMSHILFAEPTSTKPTKMLLLCLSLLVAVVGALWLRSNSWRFKHKRLPPGSMGWPVIGELIPYIRIARSERPFEFTREREAKYGPVYKTSLLTGKTIMLTDVEGVKFVLQNEGILFETGYPKSLKDVMGEYAMLFQHGDLHKRMHAMIRRFINSTPLKKHLTREIEMLTKQAMSTWPRGQRLLLHNEAQKITHNFIMKQLFGLEPGKLSSTILEEFNTLMAGIIGVPVMVPGTPYYKAMKAREKLLAIMKSMVATRRAHPEIENRDILQALIEELKEGESDDIIFDNVLICIANGEGIPSAILTFAIKHLSECPKALEQIREENLAIRRGKDPSEGLSWNDYMSLQFTHCVYNETLRLANGAQGLMRRALKDVEYRGYVIPKGWTVLPYFLNIHFDEDMFTDPTKFHPWRWQEKNIPSNYFWAFGGGPRICPGQELAKLQTSVFLHYFVTQFKWEAESDTVINFPKIDLKRKLPVVLQDL